MSGRRLSIFIVLASVLLFVGAQPAGATTIPTHTGYLGAGYLSSPTGGVTTATVAFKVPVITCSRLDAYIAAEFGLFGLDGTSEGPRMQAFVLASCIGNVSYSANLVGSGIAKGFGVASGDTIVTNLIEYGPTTIV